MAATSGSGAAAYGSPGVAFVYRVAVEKRRDELLARSENADFVTTGNGPARARRRATWFVPHQVPRTVFGVALASVAAGNRCSDLFRSAKRE